MGLTVNTEPTTEPVTRDEAKLFARIDANSTEENALVDTLIKSARQKAEVWTRRALGGSTTRYLYTLDEWPCDGEIKLPRPRLSNKPAAPIVVKYLDFDGDEVTVDEDDYWVDENSEPGRLWPVSFWPSGVACAPGAIRILYNGGYGDGAQYVPDLIKTAIKKTVATWYAFREDIVAGVLVPELPQTALMDLEHFRVMEFM